MKEAYEEFHKAPEAYVKFENFFKLAVGLLEEALEAWGRPEALELLQESAVIWPSAADAYEELMDTFIKSCLLVEEVAEGLKRAGKLSTRFQELYDAYKNLAYSSKEYVELVKRARQEIGKISPAFSIYEKERLKKAICDLKNAFEKLGKAYKQTVVAWEVYWGRIIDVGNSSL